MGAVNIRYICGVCNSKLVFSDALQVFFVIILFAYMKVYKYLIWYHQSKALWNHCHKEVIINVVAGPTKHWNTPKYNPTHMHAHIHTQFDTRVI